MRLLLSANTPYGRVLGDIFVSKVDAFVVKCVSTEHDISSVGVAYQAVGIGSECVENIFNDEFILDLRRVILEVVSEAVLLHEAEY